MRYGTRLLAASGLLFWALPALAQAPASSAPATPPPPPTLSGNVSFGLGVTSGNIDTVTANGSYDLKYNQASNNAVMSSGLFLYGKTSGELSSEQYRLSLRDEYSISTRTFLYGDVRYLHDRFKGIRYLIAPTAGVGYKVVDEKQMTLSLSAGLGGAFEQDYAVPRSSNGAATFEQRFTRKLSATTTIGQSFSALWDISDFGNGLYLLGANVTAALVGKAQLKVEALDTYKTRPPLPTLRKNDFTLIAGIVYKF